MKYAVIGICVLLWIGYSILKHRQRKMIQAMTKYISSGRMQEYDELLSSKETARLLPLWERRIMELRRTIFTKDNQRATIIFDELHNMNGSNKEKKALYCFCFDYFVALHDRERSKLCYDFIMLHEKQPDQLALYKNIYEIVIEGRTEGLDSLIAETAKLPNGRKYINETLIAMIYGKLGDKKQEENYKQAAKKHLMLLQMERNSDGKFRRKK